MGGFGDLGDRVGDVPVLGIALVAVALALWFALYMFMLTWTRPADVRALPASQDLPGDEPPAVVSLLAGRWRLSEDAAESTLIDLAARDLIEFRQPGNDPTHTTVHLLRPRPGAPAVTLTSYEQQVLDHVRSQAVDDVVPLTALTFRDVGTAHSWTRRLHSSVIDDARARGLTRRRFSAALVSMLSVAAAVPAGAVALVFLLSSDDAGGAPGAGFITFGILVAIAGRPLGERDTPAGREAAARWFGLRAFLRNDEVFAELPPAAVAVWDRYLSYGDALGITRVCSALIDLGMGDRKRVWSSHGGTWHRVRVRYPRFGSRYGSTATRLMIFAAIWLLVGGFILKSFGPPNSAGDRAGLVIFVIGLLAFGNGLYRVVRMAIDLAAPRTLSGEVLWIELWKSTQERENKPSVPLVHYFAVDDGSSDRTTAWAVPSDWSGQARPGDLVTVTVRPWTRRITLLTVDSSRVDRLMQSLPPVTPATTRITAPTTTPGTLAGPPTGELPSSSGLDGNALDLSAVAAIPLPGPLDAVALPVAAAVVAAGATAGAQPAPGLTQLLTIDEVGAALGRPVILDGGGGRVSLGPFELVTFADAANGSPMLVAAVARGAAVRLVRRGFKAGQPLAGVGDEAWTGPGWVLGHRSGTMIRLSLDASAGVGPGVLPGLLATALTRVP